MAECLCDECAALCCRYIALPLDNPKSVQEYDNIRWYLVHENIVVFIEKKQWYLGIMTRCKHLQQDNRCGIYETRPKICRGYTTDNCDYHGGEYDFEKLFTSAEQLREYAEEKLGRSIIPRSPRKKKPVKRLRVTLPAPAKRTTTVITMPATTHGRAENGRSLSLPVLSEMKPDGRRRGVSRLAEMFAAGK